MTTTEPGAANTQQPTDRPAAVWSVEAENIPELGGTTYTLFSPEGEGRIILIKEDADELCDILNSRQADLNRYESETAALRDELERRNQYYEDKIELLNKVAAENERLRSGLSAEELPEFLEFIATIGKYWAANGGFFQFVDKLSASTSSVPTSEVIAAFRGREGKG